MTTAQHKLNADLTTAQRTVAERREAERRNLAVATRILLTQAETERKQMHEELRGLSTANETLSKQLSDLKMSNDELTKRLKAAAVDVSKVRPIHEKEQSVAEQPREAGYSQLAESRPPGPSSLKFWVSFREGTSEESIEHLITEIHGRRGSLDGGWYPVEVAPLPIESQDHFLENLRHAEIVKALRISANSPPQ